MLPKRWVGPYYLSMCTAAALVCSANSQPHCGTSPQAAQGSNLTVILGLALPSPTLTTFKPVPSFLSSPSPLLAKWRCVQEVRASAVPTGISGVRWGAGQFLVLSLCVCPTLGIMVLLLVTPFSCRLARFLRRIQSPNEMEELVLSDYISMGCFVLEPPAGCLAGEDQQPK